MLHDLRNIHSFCLTRMSYFMIFKNYCLPIVSSTLTKQVKVKIFEN